MAEYTSHNQLLAACKTLANVPALLDAYDAYAVDAQHNARHTTAAAENPSTKPPARAGQP